MGVYLTLGDLIGAVVGGYLNRQLIPTRRVMKNGLQR
jgi:hypothetical protein